MFSCDALTSCEAGGGFGPLHDFPSPFLPLPHVSLASPKLAYIKLVKYLFIFI